MVSPASEGSLLISTISHCSLAAGRIDSSTWLRQTSGSRKHRGHRRREPLLLLRLRLLSFLSGTGAQCNKSETGEEGAEKKNITHPLPASGAVLSLRTFPLRAASLPLSLTLPDSTPCTCTYTHDGHPHDALGTDYRVTHEVQV